MMRFQGFARSVAALAVALTVSVAAPVLRAQGGDTVLKPGEVQKLLPASVYYKGQSAPTQLRNSGGVKFGDGSFLLATLVDNSGYASDVAAKYQAYFVAESPVKIGGQSLPAGVYGAGFIGGEKFVITDVGGHDVLTADSATDADMKRPLPLQVTADAAGGFRLYAGRRFVKLTK